MKKIIILVFIIFYSCLGDNSNDMDNHKINVFDKYINDKIFFLESISEITNNQYEYYYVYRQNEFISFVIDNETSKELIFNDSQKLSDHVNTYVGNFNGKQNYSNIWIEIHAAKVNLIVNYFKLIDLERNKDFFLDKLFTLLGKEFDIQNISNDDITFISKKINEFKIKNPKKILEIEIPLTIFFGEYYLSKSSKINFWNNEVLNNTENDSKFSFIEYGNSQVGSVRIPNVYIDNIGIYNLVYRNLFLKWMEAEDFDNSYEINLLPIKNYIDICLEKESFPR